MRTGLALVLVLAGCGGGGSGPTDKGATATATREASGGDTLSAAAWSRRVEVICAKSESTAATAGRRLGRRSAAAGDSKRELAAKVLRLQSRLVDPFMDRIAALPKPQGREQEAADFVAGMRDIGDVLGRTATAIERDDRANGPKLVAQLKAKTVRVRSQARALGIERCNPSPGRAG